ncbi:hypothetical protein CDL15_Pgr008864 [Punica granatum]|uniref:Uncharacterized protein n=1 Tax=Punica granatum TaxID=22663 RepID=A0A218VXI1_PUNGR|nr:hypothetical protein CDL15_Pgr008864 [Punica granatum]PKI36496.1 hypothetical protein CRG98_043114 [Punica granatum]
MCDYVTGDVIVVDLTCSCLRGAFQPNNTLFTLSNVQTLYLRGNDLTGDIPSSICRMHSLENLSLADNKLGDLIPPCLGNLSKIAYLSLSFNRMQGSLLMRYKRRQVGTWRKIGYDDPISKETASGAKLTALP